jgi:hypothetical protein
MPPGQTQECRLHPKRDKSRCEGKRRKSFIAFLCILLAFRETLFYLS